MPSESGPTSPTATNGDDRRQNSIDATDCNGRNGTAKLTRPVSWDQDEISWQFWMKKLTSCTLVTMFKGLEVSGILGFRFPKSGFRFLMLQGFRVSRFLGFKETKS
jgi:hypothetical protein